MIWNEKMTLCEKLADNTKFTTKNNFFPKTLPPLYSSPKRHTPTYSLITLWCLLGSLAAEASRVLCNLHNSKIIYEQIVNFLLTKIFPKILLKPLDKSLSMWYNITKRKKTHESITFYYPWCYHFAFTFYFAFCLLLLYLFRK